MIKRKSVLLTFLVVLIWSGCSDKLNNPVADLNVDHQPVENFQTGTIGESDESDINYDGYYVGKDTTLFDFRKYDILDVPPVRPKQLENVPSDCKNTSQSGINTQVVWYVNGANSDVSKQYQNMIEIANTLRQPVVGIHNGTRGGQIQDIILEPNEEVEVSIQQSIEKGLAAEQHIQFWVHSQGAFHLSRVLRKVAKTTSNEALHAIDVETNGGAGKFFPNGPQYVHYANKRDPVPNTAGVTGPLAKPGNRSVIIVFDDVLDDSEVPSGLNPVQHEFIRAHDQTVYLRNRLDFRYARRLAPSLGTTTIHADEIACMH